MLAIFNQQEALKTKIEFCCDARGTAVVPMCMHSSPVRGRGGLGISRRGGVQLEPWQGNYVLIPPLRINNK